jgi:hypothetical protein
MMLGGKLMTALRTSGSRKLEEMWKQQKQQQIERRVKQQAASKQ